jgi:Prokaryotic N-terminal methylation motif
VKTLSKLPIRRRRTAAFTLVEMLISIGILVVLVLVVMGLVNTASSLTTKGQKHISTDTQARVVFDRMAIDFANMVKRPDIDYYLKCACGTTCKEPNAPGQSCLHSPNAGQKNTSYNDQMAFFSQVPAYYTPGYTFDKQGAVSLVAYRVNSASTSPNYYKLQRMAQDLLWNGVANNVPPSNPNYISPIVFLPCVPGSSTCYLGDVINTYWPLATGTADESTPTYYETIGPGVFRFEYYYLLKSGHLSQNPWDTTLGHTSINGLADVEAIIVSIAVIDSESRSLLGDANIVTLANNMDNFNGVNQHLPPGQTYVKANDLENQWNCVVTNGAAGSYCGNYGTYPNPNITAMPQPGVSAIRVYTRCFDLNNF